MIDDIRNRPEASIELDEDVIEYLENHPNAHRLVNELVLNEMRSKALLDKSWAFDREQDRHNQAMDEIHEAREETTDSE